MDEPAEDLRVKWEKCLMGCCPPSQWIQLTAWTHIIVYTTTAILSILAMLVEDDKGNFGVKYMEEILRFMAIILFIAVSLCLPLFPAVGLGNFLTWMLPNLRWKRMGRGDYGELGILIWIEIVVFIIFDCMAIILLIGFQKKKRWCLNAWLIFAGLCVIIVVMETVIFVILQSIIRHSDQFNVPQILAVFARAAFILPTFLCPMGAVQIFRKQEINHPATTSQVTGDDHLRLHGDIVVNDVNQHEGPDNEMTNVEPL